MHPIEKPIIVLFGQPASGKSTLAKELSKSINSEWSSVHTVDGDSVRSIFSNADYSRAGRVKNLNRISDIAKYMSYQVDVVIVAAVFPYQEARDYLNSLHWHVTWVHLTFDGERGREKFFATDFEEPSGKTLKLNTSKYGIKQCAEKICAFHREISDAARGAQVPFSDQD